MQTTMLWTEAQTAELRRKVLRADENGEEVLCPEDGAVLDLEPDHAVINLCRAVRARCSKCQRMDRFA